MRLPPIIATLTRHKLIVLLMIATIALTSAVVSNVAVMIAHRLTLLHSPSGLRESELITVDSSNIYDGQNSGTSLRQSRFAQYQEDVTALKGIEGVDDAATISGLPFQGGTGIDISRSADVDAADTFQATVFIGGRNALKTLGLRLIQGRDFFASEYLPAGNMDNLSKVSVAVVSRSLADRLFHTDEVVGRMFYSSSHPMRIVGVVDHLMGMSPQLGATDNEYAMLLPLEPDGDDVTFVLNASAQDHGRVLQRAIAILGSHDPTRILDNAESFTQVRTEYFQRDSSMVALLLTSGLALLAVTAAGIMGLVSFWVQQRAHSIGIRRALGATRADILRYFLVENFLIVTGGVLLGGLLACALNVVLVKYFAAEIMPLGYLAVGAFGLWLIGQMAGLGPTLRAATVPPAVATRSI